MGLNSRRYKISSAQIRRSQAIFLSRQGANVRNLQPQQGGEPKPYGTAKTDGGNLRLFYRCSGEQEQHRGRKPYTLKGSECVSVGG